MAYKEGRCSESVAVLHRSTHPSVHSKFHVRDSPFEVHPSNQLRAETLGPFPSAIHNAYTPVQMAWLP